MSLEQFTDHIGQNLQRYLTNYYASTAEEQNIVVDLDDVVDLASHMWSTDGTVYDCSSHPSRRRPSDATPYASNRESFFVKLVLGLDTNRQPGRPIQAEYRAFFGEVLCFFQHHSSNGRQLLALMRICDVAEDANRIWPFIQTVSKIKVVDINSIVCLCGRVKTSKRTYVCWKYSCEHDVPLGAINQL
ncbi:hypothetical protein BCR43DRAFT_504146 [Syncephalastrum racemosum]|uniref:Uncharacterized protein n=1 Tax=Syncephalastrum racemosum TaxID=13706 RepID=A0A1X2HE29_SYNRA|nr:hypothetical protein BCR43DRAFT_504146 [Syncephalastrum racemosum]